MKLEKKITRIIQKEVGWFNGWHATDEQELDSCQKATKKILRILGKISSLEELRGEGK